MKNFIEFCKENRIEWSIKNSYEYSEPYEETIQKLPKEIIENPPKRVPVIVVLLEKHDYTAHISKKYKYDDFIELESIDDELTMIAMKFVSMIP
jgi:hypothetical protein